MKKKQNTYRFPGNRAAMDGNTAVILCERESSDAAGAYPITPASDILHQLSTYKHFGVRTFQDLAALSSDEIVSRFKAADQIAPTKSECEAWISQAQVLTTAADPSNETESESEDSEEQANSTAGAADEWKPFASFVVEYLGRTVEGETEQRRTKVHHLETDTDTNWPNIVTVELCRWMLEQTGEIAAPELDQLFEESRARLQRELEQELEEQRAAAQLELQQTVEDNINKIRYSPAVMQVNPKF